MNDQFHHVIMGAWECALAGSRVIYLSGPITTGPKLVERLRLEGTVDERALIRDNIGEIRAAADRLRSDADGTVVVEPGSLSVEGWTQREYIDLWETFIERFAKVVVFMPGWEMSAGCAKEYARAMENGLPTRALVGTPIYFTEGRARLLAALDEIAPYRHHAAISRATEAIVDALDRLSKIECSALDPGRNATHLFVNP